MPTPQEMAALRLGLANVKDPIEKRNLRFGEAKRIFDDPATDPSTRNAMQSIMDEENPSPIWNALRGTAYGVGEGLVTPWVMRDVLGMKDPGVPTGGNQVGRIAGNIGGAVVGLGKALPLMMGAKAAPKAMAAAYGAYGAGQGMGSHDEAEVQKTGQRDFLTGAGQEIPSYIQPSSATSVPGMANIGGQAILSALSGGLGQKANLLKLPYTKASLAANTVEGFGSGGLMLNDAMGGPQGVMDAFRDNPSGMTQTAGMLLGLGSASAAAPVLANKIQSRRGRALDNAPAPKAEPPSPDYPDPTPMDWSDDYVEPLRGVVSPEMLNALKLARMREMAERNPAAADRHMQRSLLDQTQGTLISRNPQTGRTYQVLAQYGQDAADEIGLDPRRSGSWELHDRENGEVALATADFLHNNNTLSWQPPGGGKSVKIPPGFQPMAYAKNRLLLISGGEKPVKVRFEGPTESLIENDQGGLSLVPNSRLNDAPKADEAKAPKNEAGDPLQRKGFSQKVPSISEFGNWMDSIETALGIKRADMASHQMGKPPDLPTPAAEPWDAPTLPFDFDDILKAREWDLTKSTPARPRR